MQVGRKIANCLIFGALIFLIILTNNRLHVDGKYYNIVNQQYPFLFLITLPAHGILNKFCNLIKTLFQ